MMATTVEYGTPYTVGAPAAATTGERLGDFSLATWRALPLLINGWGLAKGMKKGKGDAACWLCCLLDRFNAVSSVDHQLALTPLSSQTPIFTLVHLIPLYSRHSLADCIEYCLTFLWLCNIAVRKVANGDFIQSHSGLSWLRFYKITDSIKSHSDWHKWFYKITILHFPD